LTVIHIFGFESPEALPLAEQCGVAFQLTNILRDVREDAESGRVYLPEEDLERFGVAGFGGTPEFPQMMEFEARRAREYYEKSAPLVGMIRAESRASLRALIGIYSRLLDRIVDSGYDVLARRIRVPTWEKAWVVVRSRWA